MPYECFYTEVFVSDLEALDKLLREAMLKKIEQIGQNPFHFEFLSKAQRLQKARVGGYRIIFRVDGTTIRFYRAGKRDIVYKELRAAP